MRFFCFIQVRDKRDDDFGDTVRLRLQVASTDLHAADARYVFQVLNCSLPGNKNLYLTSFLTGRISFNVVVLLSFSCYAVASVSLCKYGLQQSYMRNILRRVELNHTLVCLQIESLNIWKRSYIVSKPVV